MMNAHRFDDDAVQQARLIGEPIHDGLARQDMRSSCVECGKRIADVPYRGAGCQTIHETCYQRAMGRERPGHYGCGVESVRALL